MTMANRTTQNPKKRTFVRSVIAAALAEALMMGSAMAVGTDAKNTLVAESFDIAAVEETSDTDGTDASGSSSLDETTSSLTLGAPQRRAIGVMNEDPQFAVDGASGLNNADLNGADPATNTALAMGVSSNASGSNAVAAGVQAVAASDNSVALGSRATTGADQPYAVAVGSNASTRGTQAIALGANVRGLRLTYAAKTHLQRWWVCENITAR